MSQDVEILALADRVLGGIAPRAQEIDLDPEAVKWAWQLLADNKLVALRISEEYGGSAISEKLFRRFQELVAQTSGSLAFLQTQHQSAASLISRSENRELKNAYLPAMVDGRKALGIGFSQLRRPGPPIMTAEPAGDGYILNGEVPWITGYDIFREFVIGATLPTGQAMFAVVPFESTESIQLSEPMRLCAMESALTVSGTFTKHPVTADKVLFIRPSDWIAKNDMINITLQGHFALGCAQAGINVLRQAFERRGHAFVQEAADALQVELDQCRAQAEEAQADGNQETTAERLQIRASAIDLAVRCAHAAITASSGAANSLAHPAQRIYREALVYTVSAQTTDIMRATLERLVR